MFYPAAQNLYREWVLLLNFKLFLFGISIFHYEFKDLFDK